MRLGSVLGVSIPMSVNVNISLPNVRTPEYVVKPTPRIYSHHVFRAYTRRTHLRVMFTPLTSTRLLTKAESWRLYCSLQKYVIYLDKL